MPQTMNQSHKSYFVNYLRFQRYAVCLFHTCARIKLEHLKITRVTKLKGSICYNIFITKLIFAYIISSLRESVGELLYT